jgi:hypothetical protein
MSQSHWLTRLLLRAEKSALADVGPSEISTKPGQCNRPPSDNGEAPACALPWCGQRLSTPKNARIEGLFHCKNEMGGTHFSAPPPPAPRGALGLAGQGRLQWFSTNHRVVWPNATSRSRDLECRFNSSRCLLVESEGRWLPLLMMRLQNSCSSLSHYRLRLDQRQREARGRPPETPREKLRSPAATS